MELILFFAFSTLEYIAIIFLLLTLFRLPVRDYLLPLVTICIVENLISFSLRFNIQLANYAIIIQILMMVVLFKFFWRIQWFYSHVAVVVSYCTYLAIQLFVFLVMNHAGVFAMEQLQREIVEGVTLLGCLLQFSSSLTTYSVTYLIKRKNLGWQFIPDAYRKVDYFKPLNLVLLVMSSLSIIFFSSIIFIGLTGDEIYFLIMFLILILILTSLIKLSNKKDAENG